MKRISVVIAAIALCVGVAAHAAVPAPLDGKTFVGTVVQPGEATPSQDNFIFKDGTFKSTACEKYGFGDAPYTSTPTGSTVSFEATTSNKDGDKIVWHGNVIENKIAGTAQRFPHGSTTAQNMTFAGSMEAKS